MTTPNPNFDWIPIYKELANKLLLYKNDRSELIKVLNEIFIKVDMKNPFQDYDKNIYDVCPFTVFASFNRGLTTANRIKILREFKDKFGLTTEIPTSFDGIPRMSNQSMCFYGFADKRKENDIQNLWEIFDAAVSYADSPTPISKDNFVKWFDTVVNQDYAKWSLTMGLFWIRPENYINLDKMNREFLNKNNILSQKLTNSNPPSAKQYLLIIDECKKYLNDSSTIHTFWELSYAAFTGEPDPNQSFSWHIVSDTCVTKDCDVTVKRYLGSFLAKLVHSFFRVDGFKEGEKRPISVTYEGVEYICEINSTRPETRKYAAIRIWLRSIKPLVTYLKDVSEEELLTKKLVFEKTGTDKYNLIMEDIEKTPNTMINKLASDDSKVNLCWYVNAISGDIDETDRFINEGIWQNDADDKYLDVIKTISVGDKIAIKSTSVQSKNIPFDVGKKPVSVMSIKAIGTVIKNYGDGKKLDVAWEKLDPPKYWYFFTFIARVWKVESKPDDWMYQALLDFTFADKPQDYKRFLDNPFWGERYKINDESEPPVIIYPPYTSQDFLDDVFLSREKYNTIKNLLHRKKNIILCGPPGVGKTFMAQRLAYSILGSKDKTHLKIIQFHQNYSYEDFIQGYRPIENGFVIKSGPFYDFCKKAEADLEHKYFFIIDEINRGNLSKIFGELLMLIEADKRGKEVKILYSDAPFSVPENLYIIGMMNTADRSLAMIDYALRRRFSFFELHPAFDEESFVKRQKEINDTDYDKLVSAVKQVNKMIMDDSSLGMGCVIGHSYLCLKSEDVNTETLQSIVEYEILPLLKEYWFDNKTNFEAGSTLLRKAVSLE